MSEQSITCPRCGKTSYSPSDIKARYCAVCHLFHDQLRACDVVQNSENGSWSVVCRRPSR